VKPTGYWAELMWAIQTAVAGLDIQLLVHYAHEDTSTEESYARQAGGAVDGVMIVNSGNDPIVGRILEAKLPAVEIGDPYSQLPFVGAEAEKGVRLAMEHLKERGYRRPALVDWKTNYLANAAARERGFAEPARSLFGICNPESRVVVATRGNEAFPLLRTLEPSPDSIVCAGDELAYEVLHCYNRIGLDAPKDIGVVGFDALRTLGSNRILTSVKTPLLDMARLAVRKLLLVVDGKPVEHGTVLPHGLRLGDTT
jgi:DNA-binding LacI/PurR family transcriptional regulator